MTTFLRRPLESRFPRLNRVTEHSLSPYGLRVFVLNSKLHFISQTLKGLGKDKSLVFEKSWIWLYSVFFPLATFAKLSCLHLLALPVHDEYSFEVFSIIYSLIKSTDCSLNSMLCVICMSKMWPRKASFGVFCSVSTLLHDRMFRHSHGSEIAELLFPLFCLPT